jgi:hypothetical protein
MKRVVRTGTSSPLFLKEGFGTISLSKTSKTTLPDKTE